MALRNQWLFAGLVCGFTAFGRAAAPKLDQAVPFELGAAEFHGGDSITVAALRCDRPSLEPNATCRVSGHYILQSKDRATLLFSVTEPEAAKRPTKPRQTLAVSRGAGDFTLVQKLVRGYPHVTFYDFGGYPVSGVYFGHGESLLETKSWRYDVGPNDNDHLGR